MQGANQKELVSLEEMEKELVSLGVSTKAVNGIIEVLSLKSLSKLEEVSKNHAWDPRCTYSCISTSDNSWLQWPLEDVTRRKSRDLSIELVRPMFRELQNEVAKELRVSHTTLKTWCRIKGIKRWPYRILTSMDGLARNVEGGDGLLLVQYWIGNMNDEIKSHLNGWLPQDLDPIPLQCLPPRQNLLFDPSEVLVPLVHFFSFDCTWYSSNLVQPVLIWSSKVDGRYFHKIKHTGSDKRLVRIDFADCRETTMKNTLKSLKILNLNY